ncbi:hypothetical protein PF005_g26451 [Phytophthora fragariae]|uniref:Secreted protein n=1 Tax=Phytophthora fragariae TaxID=53985 RepID=A0A6A3Q9K3_9STRA|nr:hypothetical protein PF003_g11074 [Phytophthora fragariae]KAE8922618.1 hypothetical protein PF009_g27119 [Phytophthora fragariae]KAE8973198.1 hypothetical protein PF011_g25350 [Phytophthora fragariae]KAE9071694.1 hypothetical protein PF007_g26462 [Phytophthora fragariae]KAE9073700.1 hypothetical protein PF010_g24966 [Phytophthora fragariae]
MGTLCCRLLRLVQCTPVCFQDDVNNNIASRTINIAQGRAEVFMLIGIPTNYGTIYRCNGNQCMPTETNIAVLCHAACILLPNAISLTISASTNF